MTKNSQDNNWIIISILSIFLMHFHEYLTEKFKYIIDLCVFEELS